MIKGTKSLLLMSDRESKADVEYAVTDILEAVNNYLAERPDLQSQMST